MLPTTTAPAATLAYTILRGFEKHYRWFCRVTGEARERFEQARWQHTLEAQKRRIATYDKSLSHTVSEIYQHIDPHHLPAHYWAEVKAAYLMLLDAHPQFELAETFFNSIIGRLYRHRLIEPDIMFVHSSRCHLTGPRRHQVTFSLALENEPGKCVDSIFAHYRFHMAFEDYQRDRANLVGAIKQGLAALNQAVLNHCELLQPVFYRGRTAYLIGRIYSDQAHPFAIALKVSDEGKLYVDAFLRSRKDLSILFGFARSYFMCDTQHPAEVVAFLHELLPNKKPFELYTAIGLYKHGKTEFYRHFLSHLDNSEDAFAIAPGIRGLVMMVFHLPSYGIVFKVIKDQFAESKKFGRDHVIDRYRLVKMHDRVGRMADTHEFANFRLPLQRIAPALMEELVAQCGNSLEIEGDTLIIKHLYIERKMTPLNLYLTETLPEEKKRDALQDLGDCIKHIALANIFPGDMLHKNFGITRHGRVIFYDYDEICYMHERNFRALPHNDDPFAIDTLSVGHNDVFPEQFKHFIVGRKDLKTLFIQLHPQLFSPEFWQQLQQRCANEISHFTPYAESRRFFPGRQTSVI